MQSCLFTELFSHILLIFFFYEWEYKGLLNKVEITYILHYVFFLRVELNNTHKTFSILSDTAGGLENYYFLNGCFRDPKNQRF